MTQLLSSIYTEYVTQVKAIIYIEDNHFVGEPTQAHLPNISLLIGFVTDLSRLVERLANPRIHDGTAPKFESLASLHYE